jgi:hypothetical protein
MSDHLRRLLFAAPSTSPGVEHVRIGGFRPRFVLQFSTRVLVVCSGDVTSANRQPNRTALRSQDQAQIRPCNKRHIITLPRRYACQESMRLEMRSARSLTVNNSGIDARNGQAYHGRKTTTTNGTRPAVARSRAGKGSRARRYRCRCFAPCVRSSAGAPGRT